MMLMIYFVRAWFRKRRECHALLWPGEALDWGEDGGEMDMGKGRVW